MSAAVVGDIIYVLGGNHGHDPAPLDVATVQRYDPATDRWEERPPLPWPLSHAEPSTVVWRDGILLGGGRSRPTARETVADIIRYDPATGRTDPVGRLPRELIAPLLVVVDDTVYGGLGGGGEPPNRRIWKAPLLDAWQRGEDMPVALGEVAAAVIGDRLFVVGDGSSATLAMNVRSGWWDPVTAWPGRLAPGHHHAALVVDGKLVLIGGFAWQSEGVVQVFDPRTRRWAVGPALPFPAGSAASAVIGNRIYVAGGIVNGRTTNRVAVLDSLGGRWRSAAPMPLPRNHAATATDGTLLYVFGGRGPGSGDANVVANGFAEVQVYDPRTDAWTVSGRGPGAPSPLPVGRGGMGAAVYRNGEFWVIGGETLDGPGASSRGTYARVDIYNPVANRWRDGPRLAVARHGIFPVLDGTRIIVAGGGTQRGRSASAVVEMLAGWRTGGLPDGP